MRNKQSFYIETFGCQMNLADTEVVIRILNESGFTRTNDASDAGVILINTCAVRSTAEQRIIGRLGDFSVFKKADQTKIIGVLGCMAERVCDDLMDSKNFIDLVAGPDEYRKLPGLIDAARKGERGIAVNLSFAETYDDILPVRTDSISAWVSIMRGCNKFCSYCVVPFTRGRERSRTVASIINEVEELSHNGFKEVTLLGQNVNSYKDDKSDFADLILKVSEFNSEMRVRFITSNPQDMSDKLIKVIASRDNICNSIHLPVQSGSDRILELMNRNYTASHYLNLIHKIKETIPDVSLSTDIITGFPTETDDDHKRTLSLLQEVEFDGAFTFKYSPRENTKAWEIGDDVPETLKLQRLDEIIDMQRSISLDKNKILIGKTVEVLIEGPSKRSEADFCGRTKTNKMVIFRKNGDNIGDFIGIRIERVNSATLFGMQNNHLPDQIVKSISQEV